MQLFGPDGLMDVWGSKLPAGIDPQDKYEVVSNAVYVTRRFDMASSNGLRTHAVDPGIWRDWSEEEEED